MSYNLVNPTTGALTKVSGNITSNIIPANASAHNKLVATSDTVKRISYNISGTTDAIEDTKALVNHILTLDSGSYIGEFKRTGITYGSFRLTYFVDGDGSISVSGTVTYSISNNNDATYQVSYVLSNGSATPYWNIEKLVVARENNFTYQVLTTDSDLNDVKTSGAYSIYISDPTSQATNHAPTYGWLQLIVIQMNNSQSFCNQILYSADGKMFMRECGNGTWTDWQKLVTKNELGYAKFPTIVANSSQAIKITRNSISSGTGRYVDVFGNTFMISIGDQNDRFYVTKVTQGINVDVTTFARDTSAMYIYANTFQISFVELLGDLSYEVIAKSAIPAGAETVTIQ